MTDRAIGCPKCDGLGTVTVRTPAGDQQWICGDCHGGGMILDPACSEEIAAAAIREVLSKYKVAGLVQEIGSNGDMRITMSVVLPVGVAEEVVEMVRSNTIRV